MLAVYDKFRQYILKKKNEKSIRKNSYYFNYEIKMKNQEYYQKVLFVKDNIKTKSKIFKGSEKVF